jgi:RHS repeat-associated protein
MAQLPQRTTSSVGGVTVDQTFVRSGATLTAGPHHHTFDAVGRVVERDGVKLTYGPLGQVASATNGLETWSYVYDEAGQRVAKLNGDGTFRAGYLGDSYLDRTSLTTPVRVAGALIGLVRHTREGGATKSGFTLVFNDSRGTVLADTDGTLRMPSPFGARDTHPDVAAAVDYASKGWDADLGAVRMGVRDFDPVMGRWLEPDPLYLAEPAKCAESAVDCSLYAYARGNPVSWLDPDGREPQLAQVAQAAEHVAESGVFRVGTGAAAAGGTATAATTTAATTTATATTGGTATGIGALAAPLALVVANVAIYAVLVDQLHKLWKELPMNVPVIQSTDSATQPSAAPTVAPARAGGNGGGTDCPELRRPYIRKWVTDAVASSQAKDSSGKFIDRNTRQPIEGTPDLGHVAGHEFWREKAAAENKCMSQPEFNDYMNNPEFYEYEDPSSNRSHQYEMPR